MFDDLATGVAEDVLNAQIAEFNDEDLVVLGHRYVSTTWRFSGSNRGET